MSQSHRVIFIGLDAAERDLLRRWSDAGHLPNVRALRETGAEGEAGVIPGFGSGAMWPSFATGVSPARHGRYFGHAPDAAGYTVRKRVHEIQATSFWETLSDAGKRVAIINVPYARRSAAGLNGVEVFDWATHNPVLPTPQTWPENLADELVERHGTDPVGPCDRGGLGQPDIGAFRDRLLERVQRKADLALDILDRERWDFYGVIFDESHCVGHQAWHVHDAGHPDHDPGQREAIGDPVFDVYCAIDAAIGRILERADDNTTVVLASVTGMGPNYNANWMLEEIIRPLETQQPDARLRLIGMARSAWRRLPMKWRKAIRRHATDLEERHVRAAERSRRDAFALPHNDISGAIRLNVRGREPNGHIEPGTDYERHLQRLITHLQGLTNAETGEPLVATMIEPRRIMSGEHIERMPDLLLEWNRNAPIRRIGIPDAGELINDSRGVRLGDHTTHGLLLARGPGLTAGRIESHTSVMDFAPTLCAMLGVTLADVEGHVIEELLSPDSIRKQSTTDSSPATSTA